MANRKQSNRELDEIKMEEYKIGRVVCPCGNDVFHVMVFRDAIRCIACGAEAKSANNNTIKLSATELLQKRIDSFWFMVENGWDIEDREYFEREAPKSGDWSPEGMAVHYMWKRDRKPTPTQKALLNPTNETIKQFLEKEFSQYSEEDKTIAALAVLRYCQQATVKDRPATEAELIKWAGRVVAWFEKGYLRHSPLCNGHGIEPTSICNCGLTQLRKAYNELQAATDKRAVPPNEPLEDKNKQGNYDSK
jgi:hypothetical protein